MRIDLLIRISDLINLNIESYAIKGGYRAAAALSLSNTPLQVEVTFLTEDSYESKHTSKTHLDSFYEHIKMYTTDILMV